MKFSNLVEFVSKKPIPPYTKHLVVEVMVSDQEGEDVEARFSLYLFPQIIDGACRFHSLLSKSKAEICSLAHVVPVVIDVIISNLSKMS
jgi:hypothetical protein